MKTVRQVWVGYTDDKPHIFNCDIDGEKCVAVYATRAAARKSYQDVRRAYLCLDVPKPSSWRTRRKKYGASGQRPIGRSKIV